MFFNPKREISYLEAERNFVSPSGHVISSIYEKYRDEKIYLKGIWSQPGPRIRIPDSVHSNNDFSSLMDLKKVDILPAKHIS